jgi:hypothetical protein
VATAEQAAQPAVTVDLELPDLLTEAAVAAELAEVELDLAATADF